MSQLPPPPSGSGPIQPFGATSSPVPPAPPRGDLIGTTKGPVRLEPLGAGQTIDAAIRLYRARWKTLMAISAVIVVPFGLVQQYSIHASRHPVLIGDRVYEQAEPGVTFLFIFSNFLVLQPLIQASLMRAMAGIYLGQDVGWSASLRFGLSKLGWVLLWSIVTGILIALGLIALILGAVFLYIRFYFTIPAAVLEDARGGALGRSWGLTRGLGWHIFGTVLLAGILAAIASAILTIPAGLIAFNDTGAGLGWLFQAVLTALASVIVTPFTIGVIVLLYFDARIRKEGFDLAVMAREVGATER
jgi:hypothetical protein